VQTEGGSARIGETSRRIGEAILDVRGISLAFGGVKALTDISFDVREHEVRAIIGPNGAGKSTFFNCVTGVLRPTSGRILLNGSDIAGLPPNLISRAGIARSYQITNILPNATTLENVRIAAQSRRHGWNMLRNYRAFGDVIAKA
jgi:branched-chain amino acid transport system ATP-binding protein